MNKKIWYTIAILVIIGLSIIMAIRIYNSKGDEEKVGENGTAENIVNIAEEGITDACIDEWDDYDDYIQEQSKTTSSNANQDNSHYLIKDINGYIVVYYINENNEELLYKETTIPTDYLSQEDINNLQDGIEVVGIESLNKILEDFE